MGPAQLPAHMDNEGGAGWLLASLSGRLRYAALPKNRALLPLFEAVVNAILAVDEARGDMDPPGSRYG